MSDVDEISCVPQSLALILLYRNSCLHFAGVLAEGLQIAASAALRGDDHTKPGLTELYRDAQGLKNGLSESERTGRAAGERTVPIKRFESISSGRGGKYTSKTYFNNQTAPEDKTSGEIN